MSQRNSLMEWLEQTKRLTKEEDYMGLDIIDNIFDYLWLLDPAFVRRHKKMYQWLCAYYHKDNPIDFLTAYKIRQVFKREHEGMEIDEYEKKEMGMTAPMRKSKIYWYLKETIERQIDIQISRYYKARDSIINQWCEIIDYMWERHELINPHLAIDGYLIETINKVCRIRRKKNPLANGVRKLFGKYWRDKDGNLHKEKRVRY